ncbi:MAG: hypothetical protein KAS23_13185, partial [Anaerohalosphaera sp.]|nr:hypothetical protein [Anaerohalosphaera sp.]
MKPKDKNSISQSQSLLKTVDVDSNIDQAFLDRLGELSAQEFERAASRSDAPQPDIESIWRRIMKNRTTKFSSAAAILIAAFVGIYMLTGYVPVTFAQVIEPILKSNTISYDFIVGGDEADGVLLHDIVTESYINRTFGNATMILDLDKNRMLRLDHSKKSAVYIDTKGPLGRGSRHFIKLIRNIADGVQDNPDFAPDNIGEKVIDGHTAVGFKVDEHLVIWADTETALPVRIELQLGMQRTVLKNFEFNFPLEASMTSMEVPEGYTLEETDMDLSNVTEQDFIAGLKVWIEVILDGQFPEAITSQAYMKNIPVIEQKIDDLNLPEKEAEQLGVSYIKGMMFINMFMVQGHSDLNYAG